jgi:predicted GTPase
MKLLRRITSPIRYISVVSQTCKFSSGIFSSLFKPNHKELLDMQKSTLANLSKILKAVDSNALEAKLLDDTRAKLDDIFLLVIVGEFNVGKSTFINALLRNKILKEGVLPTTAKICILRHRSSQGTNVTLDEDYEELYLEENFLKNIALVDTPGTNALIEKHGKLTKEVIPRSDLILFVTSGK